MPLYLYPSENEKIITGVGYGSAPLPPDTPPAPKLKIIESSPTVVGSLANVVGLLANLSKGNQKPIDGREYILVIGGTVVAGPTRNLADLQAMYALLMPGRPVPEPGKITIASPVPMPATP